MSDFTEHNPHMCARFHYLVGSCKFEPRYDESSEPVVKDLPGDASVMAVFFGRDMPMKQRKTYLHDVCIRCGKVSKRGGDNGSPHG